MYRWLLLVWFSILCCYGSVVLADEPKSGLDQNLPIEITAQQLEVLQQQRQSVFTGDVVARRGDMTLHAKKMTVVFQQDQDQIERLEATGGVRVVQLDRVATADKAFFYQEDEKLILSGNAVVTQGQNRISGDEITLYLRENRSVVKSSQKGRVRAVIVPGKQQEKQ